MKNFSDIYKREFAVGAGLLSAFLALRFLPDADFAFSLCFGLYAASLLCGAGLLPSAAAYGLSGAFFGMDVFLYTAVSLIVSVAVMFLLKALKKNISRRWVAAALFLGQIFFLAYNSPSAEVIIAKAVCASSAFVFCAVSFYAIKCVFVRGLKYRLDTDEKICLAVFAVCLSAGLAGINPWGVPLLRFAGGFAVLMSLYVFGGYTCMMTAVLTGAGGAFGTGTLTDIAVFALWGVAACSFRRVRPLCAFSVPLIDLIVKYVFVGQTISVQGTAALVAGCVVFLLVPKSAVAAWHDKFGRGGESYAARSIVSRAKNNISRKLYDLSEVFFEMKLGFQGMVKGVLPREQAKVMLAKEVSETVCKDCAERTACWRVNMEKTEKAFINMTDGALDRGKATVLDLPNAMTQKCKRLPAVLSGVNQAVERYKNYYTVATNNDNSRLLIGEQLGGVANIMKNLSEQAKESSSFDREKEAALFEELTRGGVLIKEAVVASGKDGFCVTVVVESDAGKTKPVGGMVSRVCGVRMMLTETLATRSKNWVVMTFLPAPRFDVVFGFSAAKKSGSEISGDTHTFLRIDEHRFLIGLCDGMGSGVSAEKASGTAISLIENFYKAGFDNETILTNVNRLLTLSQDETFTAVDIAVVDLGAGICDFIKIGAPCGFVKSGGNVEIISAGSLPLGVLEEMKPCVTKKALADGDIIVMASDGVTDAFVTKERMAAEIDETVFKTPQETADILLKAAVDACGGETKDDMTVIVAKIFETDAGRGAAG